MPTHPLWKTALLGGALAIVANLILLFIGRPLTGAPATFMTLSVGPIVIWTVLGSIGATVTYALTRAFSKNPERLFVTIALAVLVLSFIPDLLIHGMTTGPFAGATWGAVILLMLMHVAAAVALVVTLVRYTRAKVK